MEPAIQSNLLVESLLGKPLRGDGSEGCRFAAIAQTNLGFTPDYFGAYCACLEHAREPAALPARLAPGQSDGSAGQDQQHSTQEEESPHTRPGGQGNQGRAVRCILGVNS